MGVQGEGEDQADGKRGWKLNKLVVSLSVAQSSVLQLESLRQELSQSLEVKKGLKSKLCECKERLEEAIQKYETERKKNANRQGEQDRRRVQLYIL